MQAALSRKNGMPETTSTAPAFSVPDVNSIVEYGENYLYPGQMRKWRVTSWVREVPPAPAPEPGSIEALIFEIEQEELAASGKPAKVRMQYCLREEATHLSLTGVCGAIARIEECKVVGIVPWEEAQKARAVENAQRRGAAHTTIY